MKPLTITKKYKESLFDTAKRAVNQATINNKIVEYVDNGISCLVYPYDTMNNVIKYFKRIELLGEINRLQALMK